MARPTHSVWEQLDADWRLTAPRATTALHRWAAIEPELARYPSVDALLDAVRRSRGPEQPVLLARLARLATDDELAARLLFQLLVPGMRTLAYRLALLWDGDEADQAVAAAVWRRLRHYDPTRHPGHLAANLLRSAERELRHAARRRSSIESLERTCTALAGPAAQSAQDAGAELLEVLAGAANAGVVSLGDARLIADTRVRGTSVRELADRLGVPPARLHQRRRRAEQRLSSAGCRIRAARIA